MTRPVESDDDYDPVFENTDWEALAADPAWRAKADAAWKEVLRQITATLEMTGAELHPDDPEQAALADEHLEEARRIRDELEPPPEPPEPPDCWCVSFPRCRDDRARIRRDRGYVGQAGPPPRQNAFGPWREPRAEAKSWLQQVVPLRLLIDESSHDNPSPQNFQRAFCANARTRPRR